MSRVLAVTVGETSAAAAAAHAGAAHPVPHRTVPTLADALARDAAWVWLLDPRAQPEPDALDRLRAAAALRPAALYSSLPVDPDGRVLETALPRGDEAATALLLASVGQGLVPIRYAPLTSLLVAGPAARAAKAPEPERFASFTAHAWTGRLLAGEAGFLVLDSRVRVPPPPHPPHPPLSGLAQLRREGLLTPGEALRTATRALGISRSAGPTSTSRFAPPNS